MKKTNYFLNFIRSYHNIFLKVLFFEIVYSIRFGELLPKIKVQNNSKRTDTVPCVYYFLYQILKFLKKKKIKSVVDVGSGFGRVVNFISSNSGIKSHGIEFDKEVFKSANRYRKKNVHLYCGDVFKFDIKNFNSKCFILVDPFKKAQDNKKFLSKIKKLFPKEKKYVISVNYSKGKFPNEWKLIHSIIGSKSRTLKIFEIN